MIQQVSGVWNTLKEMPQFEEESQKENRLASEMNFWVRPTLSWKHSCDGGKYSSRKQISEILVLEQGTERVKFAKRLAIGVLFLEMTVGMFFNGEICRVAEKKRGGRYEMRLKVFFLIFQMIAVLTAFIFTMISIQVVSSNQEMVVYLEAINECADEFTTINTN